MRQKKKEYTGSARADKQAHENLKNELAQGFFDQYIGTLELLSKQWCDDVLKTLSLTMQQHLAKGLELCLAAGIVRC